MTRTEIIDAVRALARIGTADVDDTTIISFLDQGYWAISTMFRWPWLAKATTFNTVVGTQTYAVPADMLTPEQIYPDGERKMVSPISHDTALAVWGDDPGSAPLADFYSRRLDAGADKFALWPIPSTIQTYNVTYQMNPTMMTLGTHEPEWNEAFHPVLIEYALSRVYEREEFYNQRDAAYGRYQRTLLEMKRFYTGYSQNDYPLIFGGGRVPTDYRYDPRANLPFA